MSKKFPSDEFDFLEPHGGRHRARRTKRDSAREFARILVAAAIVGTIGLGGLRILDSGVQFDAPSLPTASAASQVVTVGVTVLDATDTDGLASSTAQKLVDDGWNVLTADNLNDQTSLQKTTIYISGEENRSAAKKILKTLGNFSIEISASFADPITVVLGSDFK
jgi:hypothetical protein